jgi:rubredoxin
MSLVVAMNELAPDRTKRSEKDHPKGSPARVNTTFFRATDRNPDSPSAYISKHDPLQMCTPHYHCVDQFQIIIEGRGKFGRHDVSPICVHFSRANTPYGPLRSDPEVGWAFLGLRTRHDHTGAQHSAAALDALKRTPNRSAWQIVKRIAFPKSGPGVNIEDVAEIKDDQGLFVHALTMAPATRTVAPAAAGGDGQFIVVFRGGMVHEGRELRGLAVAFINPDEPPFEIHAGSQGMEGLILNMPRVQPRAPSAAAPSSGGLKKWQCVLCSFAYDEAVGMPEDGIAPGTRWQDVPESWSCPDCGARKGDFQMVEV